MMTIAIDCVYACQKENQLPRAFAILECLPERESGWVIVPCLHILYSCCFTLLLTCHPSGYHLCSVQHEPDQISFQLRSTDVCHLPWLPLICLPRPLVLERQSSSQMAPAFLSYTIQHIFQILFWTVCHPYFSISPYFFTRFYNW